MSASAPSSTAPQGPGIADRDPGPGTGRRRRIVGGVALLAIVVAAIAIVVADPFGHDDGAGAGVATGAADTSLATVRRGPLSSQVYENGTLGYAARPDGSPYAAINQATGAFTQLPSAGDVIACGKPLYRVDDEPVALLCGRTPSYRSLYEGMEGPDVRELNRNLVALGYATRDELDPASDEFTWATRAALIALQDDLGVDETGSLDPTGFVFLPGPLRITRVMATLGTMARPGAPIAQASSTRRRVQVDLSASAAAGVKRGSRVQVTLPDNRTTPGIVTRVGTVARSSGDEQSGGSSASSTIPVTIRLTRPRAVKGLQEAPVRVEIATARVADALSVPVTALVAQAGGGYAVETVGAGGRHRLVPVTLGMFDHANGLVQVSGSGLAGGERVVVPAT